MVELPKTKKILGDLVVVDQITKFAHFIPIQMTMSMDQLVQPYMSNIVKLHGTHISKLSNTGVRFRSRVRKEFQEAIGTHV